MGVGQSMGLWARASSLPQHSCAVSDLAARGASYTAAEASENGSRSLMELEKILQLIPRLSHSSLSRCLCTREVASARWGVGWMAHGGRFAPDLCSSQLGMRRKSTTLTLLVPGRLPAGNAPPRKSQMVAASIYRGDGGAR